MSMKLNATSNLSVHFSSLRPQGCLPFSHQLLWILGLCEKALDAPFLWNHDAPSPSASDEKVTL